MKRQRFVSQGSLSRIFQEAALAWSRQDYEQTIELLERAVKLDPANAGIRLDLGRAFGLRYAYEKADGCFEQACRISQRKTETRLEAGRRALEFGNQTLAQKYIEGAASEAGAGAEVFVALAEIYERRAQLDKAMGAAERALHLDGSNGAARLTRARLDRLSGKLAEAEERARILAKGAGDPWLRARAWYELGEILDRMGRYDEAMEAFLEAKGIIRPAAANHAITLQRVQARAREMEQTVTAEVLERWATAGESLRPVQRLAILCGHPRSGTTLLEQALDAHPEVVTTEETHILHDEAYLPLCRGFAPESSALEILESTPVTKLQESREKYFRFTEMYAEEAIRGKLLIDKNPALNVMIPAVARIFPEAKLLIALRDPRDVCVSCFMQPLTPNPVSSAYLSLQGTVSQYLSVMGLWRALLPRLKNPFCEVRYENLVGDFEGTLRRMSEFLGLAWDERMLRYDEHARSKALRSPSYAEVTKPLSKRAVGRWEHYRKHMEPYLVQLEPMMKALKYA